MPSKLRRVPRSRATAAVAVGLAAALALATPSSALSRPADKVAADSASGVGDPYFPLDGNGGIDVQSYSIDDTYGFADRKLSGSTVLRITATENLTSFSLDFLLPTRSVSVDGKAAKFKTVQGHELVITPAKPIKSGQSFKVMVSYAGYPSNYRYAGESNWLASDREVVAMNEPHMSPWWFPANDHPTDKATYNVRITAPRGYQVISNGELVGKTGPAHARTWIWRTREPMATYLAFFAAGKYTIEKGETDGLPWVTATSQEIKGGAHRDAVETLRKSGPIVQGLAKDLGPYPFSSTGGLVTSLSPGFALENQTRPTYPLIGRGDTLLLVHELAHQWFGDSVSVNQWRDIWLNEGFATFMEWRWDETHGGESAASTMAREFDQTSAEDDFWKVVIGDPGSEKVFDWAVYQRGAMTVQALRNRIGDEHFWKLIHTWLDTHKGSHGSVAQFEALAEQISGQELTPFFDAWLRTPAKPARTAENGFI